jgi:drug/metabolite transporter (DMT)-like permease
VQLWLLVAVAAALLKTGYNALQKHLTVDYDGLELSYITSVLGLVFILPVGVWSLLSNDVTITPAVAAAVLLSGLVNIFAIYAFLTALELEDLSVIAPLVQLTPILVAVSEPFVLPIAFEPLLLVGAALAVVGSAVVLADVDNLLAPLSGVSSRAAMLAVAAASLFAVASLTNRFVTTRIPPLFYTFLVYFLMSAGFAVVLTVRQKRVPARDLLRGRLLALGGTTAARTSVTYVAFSLAAASRVSVALQLSIVLNVFAGGLLFGEHDIVKKSLGALLILAGVVFVV